MFVTSQGPLPAMDMAFPDVCRTPVGPAIVPIPYPDIALSNTAIPTQTKLCLTCMPAHNLVTQKPLSNGDNAGLGLGMVSNLDMGPVAAAMGSTNFFVGGTPAIKMTSPTKQNGVCPNAAGMTLSPSQVKLMSLR
ncbi:DUF4150 domain-containing protein [Xanthobacter agilis]|jgi:hypothetical protein|uniref:Tox-PAAR-like domain-containing protein n=1 Tax=Xanthobacter agilis TaxID=47492 RepID=A0ABU0LEJ6_XANAG|nr:DUF4150 domain-containing protein [Xanthobacter agilis]MDQ0505570.1 hypothetical protein [Xanthobacter agilis]